MKIKVSKERESCTLMLVFREFINSKERRISTRMLYDFAIRVFADCMGGMNRDIVTITPKEMSGFMTWLAATYSCNSAYTIYRIVKSMFYFAERHYFIVQNPCNIVAEKRNFTRHSHHQAMTRQQIEACENDFWESILNKNGEIDTLIVEDMIKNPGGMMFFRMCFMLGYYLQGLAFIDILLLRVSSVNIREVNGVSTFIIDTRRRKTGKKVKIVIPALHRKRYLLFETLYRNALNHGSDNIMQIMDGIPDDEAYIYNKVNRMSCDMSRKLKQWWNMLNDTSLKNTPIDLKNTSYYSCRHTFATLYLENPKANLSELASLMGRNTEYIDTYVREIEADSSIYEASDKVYGTNIRHADIYTTLLANQKTIMETQEKILELISQMKK